MTPREILKFNLDNGSIKAFIEGKPLQLESDGRWIGRTHFLNSNPKFCECLYRPKPEPQEGWINVYKDDNGKEFIGPAIYESPATARQHAPHHHSSFSRVIRMREVIE